MTRTTQHSIPKVIKGVGDVNVSGRWTSNSGLSVVNK
jgi:hypothetical protein